MYFTLSFFNDNVHLILHTSVFRSAQLTKQKFIMLIEEKSIQSVLNLRGKAHAAWYQQEIEASKTLGIQHYDIRLSAHKIPSNRQLVKLVSLIQKVPKPVLVHCRAGADRTGLAAASAVILNNGTESEAERQVSWRYGVISPTSVGYQVLKNYEAWLNKHNFKFSRKTFLVWAYSKPTLHPYWGYYL